MSSSPDPSPKLSMPTDPIPINQPVPSSARLPETAEERAAYRNREYPVNPERKKENRGKSSWKDDQKANVITKFKDPCAEASQQSLICLDLNDYNRGKCEPYFKAYRDCKERFAKQIAQDQKDKRAAALSRRT